MLLGTNHITSDFFFRSNFNVVLVSSIGKVSNSCIRDLGFNSHLYQKPKTDWYLNLMIKIKNTQLKLFLKKTKKNSTHTLWPSSFR